MVLLERETQLASLLQYADEARGGAGRLTLISGEAGVGKSSLVEELQASVPRATWAWGACDGLFTPRALAPVHDIAREVGGELLETVRASAGRDDIFDAVLRWLSAADGLVVLVVEDVQWADDATLDLVRFLGRRIKDLPVLLVVTFRDDALSPSDSLRVMLGELAGQRFTRRIDLPPLSATGVRRLAEGSSYAPDELYRLTGGNPFFVVSVLGSNGSEIPASARDAVLARVATIDDDSRHVLETASLGGYRVDAQLVAEASRHPIDTFDALVSAGLLQADGDALRFRHELTRRAIESDVPPHRRLALHQALLAGLLSDGCDDDARLAYHAEGAGEADLVRKYAPSAARQTAKLGAHRAAVAHYERALRFAPEDPATLAELYDDYADSLALVDRWPAAVDARQRAIAIWHELGDRRREGHANRRLSNVYWRLCRGPESLEAQARAIELLEPLGADPELSRALAARAFEVWEPDPGETDDMLGRAVAMAEELGDRTLTSDVLNNLAYLQYTRRSDWTASMSEALRIALEANAEGQAGRAYANAYTFYAAQFRFAEGERYWREGIVYCDERDITTFSTCLRGHRAIALLDMGDWEQAAQIASRVLASEASPVNLLTSQITLGLVRARRGESGAYDVLDPAVEAAGALDEQEWIAATRLARVEARWLDGDLDGARADLAAVRERITAIAFVEDGQLSVWEQRILGSATPASPLTEPWATWLSRDFAAVAAAWDRLDCPYNAALALYDSGDEDRLREAFSRFTDLGASATARMARQRMKELGHRAVPNGVRTSTREHPLGLTRRENDVLLLLCEGLSNEAIADRLVLSPRTVDHHVSAVLSKLDVTSRGAAAARARQLGLEPAGR